MTAVATDALPSLGGRPGLLRTASQSLVITRRHLVQLVRSPELIVFILVQPVMFVLLFNYVFGGAIQIPGVSYIDFLIPGVVVQMVTFASIGTGIGLNEDIDKGIMDRFRSLPIARSAVLTGRLLSDTVRIALNVLLLVGVGALIGFRFSNGLLPALGFVLLAVVFGVTMAWVAALIGLAVRNPEAVQSAGFIWLFPLTFVSSAFVPVDTMPGWLQVIAEANPVTVTVDALRGMVLGGPIAEPLTWSVLWIVGITAVFAPLAVWRYRRIS